MESKVGATSKCEQRAVIKFLNAAGVKGKEIHKCLCVVYGADTMRANMYKWKWFFMVVEPKYTMRNEAANLQIWLTKKLFL